ncbi:MAG: hypothetical protein IPM82_16395 [Saprospiraceae bacterium]|nr:hypothetical protein [Saprospiraceae bacterium]
MEKAGTGGAGARRYTTAYFQYFVFVGLALLVVDCLISWRKHHLESGIFSW